VAKSLIQVVSEVLTRLGDTDQSVWSQSEIESYLKEGYDLMAILTGYFWDSAYLDDVAGQALYDLPAQVYEIERATWNNEKLIALRTSDLIEIDSSFRTTQGQVEAYTQDMDGLRKFRKYRIPSATAGAGAEADSWGIPRSFSIDLSESTSWGLPRSLSTVNEAGQPWGIIRTGLSSDALNTRIEFTRRGESLEASDSEFEFPDRYVKYVRFFSLSRALERESPGQDLKLSGHYMDRFEEGVKRILDRKTRVATQAPLRMGGGPTPRREPPGPVWGPEFPVRD